MPHPFTMPPDIRDRVARRRGTFRALDRADPRKTALVVVDMQNAFMMPGVAHALCEMAPSIVPNINRLAAALRRAGGTVAWIRTTATQDCLTSWSQYYEHLTPPQQQKRIEALADGSPGHQFWPELDIRPEDLVVTKRRYSAFIQGASDLEAQLRGRGVDTVLITGTVTNVCCESTARDAMMRNFRTIMVSDGNAANTDAEHAHSLIAFYLNFGDVETTEAIVEHLAAGCGSAAVAAE
jgi:ureidoacrylate peracid hydrolase